MPAIVVTTSAFHKNVDLARSRRRDSRLLVIAARLNQLGHEFHNVVARIQLIRHWLNFVLEFSLAIIRLHEVKTRLPALAR